MKPIEDMKNSNFMYIVLLSILCSCLEPGIERRKLIIVNRTSQVIYCFANETDSIKNYINVYNQSDYDSAFHYFNSIEKDTMGTLHQINKWEGYLKECNDKHMRVFIIEQKLVDKYGWQTISDMNIYSCKYLLDLKTMKRIGWVLEYKGR